jgi:hypothetical protein
VGQSGPLTEGVARSKKVIGPNHGEIGFTLQHFGIGLVYESENVKALANQMDNAVLHLSQHLAEIKDNQIKYQKLLDIDAFKCNYQIFILRGT